MEQGLFMTRLDLVEDSTQSVWNICIKFDTWKEHLKLSVQKENNIVMNGKKCLEKTMQIEKFIS